MEHTLQLLVTGAAFVLSDEKQLREAQKMEAIATLAGGIAHDFNNLLTIVLGYAELLLIGKREGSAGYEELQSMLHAAKRGGDLVKRILTFSKKVETNPRPVDLNHEILECRKLLSSIIPKMVEIRLRLAEDLWKVNADPSQMEQILLNLAVNAHQAMPDGGTLSIETKNVTLDEEYCKTRLDAEPGHYVLLTVADTGEGMDQDVREHIFEPFFTTKRPGEGTGLGLSMVHGIVEKHGGFVRCYSEPGEGTIFKIYLPALTTETEISVADSGIRPAFGTETILLVDDEELILNLGKRILKRYGYTILTARNGKQALEVFRKAGNLISLVILDLIMPEMGGRQCMEEILKIDPKAKVLIASGFGMNGATGTAVEKGARGFVSKPFNMKELLQTVRRVLDEP
jgi:nitrogen-specific signal transduction histidine kinase/CheY-like chemotaxis protein